MRATRRQRERRASPASSPRLLTDEPADRRTLAARMRRAYVAHALAGALPARRRWRLKRALDLAIGLALLVVALPLGLAFALGRLVRFHQWALLSERCAARCGATFILRQFRSARSEAPAHDGAGLADAWRSASRLARLPAVWSVVTGEMSLVGPAPCAIATFNERPIGELARLYVAPGLVRLRPVGRLQRVAATRAEADLRYVTDGSWWMDCEQLAAAALLPRRRFPSPASSAEPLDTSDAE